MTRLLRKSLVAGAVCAAVLGSQGALAGGGDFSLDFTAAAPLTYNHATGGGTYDLRDVGRDKDIVESLEGGDFACGETVTFLTQIVVSASAQGSQTIRVRFEFTAYATGQQGVALVDNTAAGSFSATTNSAADLGVAENANKSVATVFSEGISGPGVFIKPTVFTREVDVNNLEAGEKVVLRTDVAIACNGQDPTGNMQARLSSASTIAATGGEAIRVGDQTIPFKHVGDIKEPPCDPKTCPK